MLHLANVFLQILLLLTCEIPFVAHSVPNLLLPQLCVKQWYLAMTWRCKYCMSIVRLLSSLATAESSPRPPSLRPSLLKIHNNNDVIQQVPVQYHICRGPSSQSSNVWQTHAESESAEMESGLEYYKTKTVKQLGQRLKWSSYVTSVDLWFVSYYCSVSHVFLKFIYSCTLLFV